MDDYYYSMTACDTSKDGMVDSRGGRPFGRDKDACFLP